MNAFFTKSINLISLAFLAGALGVGVVACVASPGTGNEASDEGANLGKASEELVSCTSDCSGAGGIAITRSGCTTCSATNTSVTCNGVTTQCTPAQTQCTPGDWRDCCPYTQGCSCPGDQSCNANGRWGACMGAGLKGHPCP